MPLNDVPLAIQTLNATQNPIRANFQTIDAAFAIDHVPYAAAGQGRHNKVSFPVQAAAPVTAADEVALFSAVSALSALPELSFRRSAAGAAYEFTSCAAASPGWARLPSGILIKWGSSNMPLAGFNVYTFPVAAGIPAFAHVYAINVATAYQNAGDGDGFVRLDNFAAPWTTFRVYGSRRTAVVARQVTYSYIAIGI
jgi:hypothetical protein